MEAALVIGIVLIAAFWILRSWKRSMIDQEKSCTCGHACSCVDSGCSCNQAMGAPECTCQSFDRERTVQSADRSL